MGHINPEINDRLGIGLIGNDNALGEIAYWAPFGNECKFQDSHIYHKKSAPFDHEYILKRAPPIQKVSPIIMTTLLRKLYKWGLKE